MYYNLTHPQKRIIYNEILYPNSTFSNLAGTVFFDEIDLNVKQINDSINYAIKIFDSLRIRLHIKGHGSRFYFTRYEYSEFPVLFFNSQTEYNYSDLINPFSLYNSNLYDFKILRFKNKCGYYFCYHHIICDAFSVSLINKTIMDHYYSNAASNQTKKPHALSYKIFINRESTYLKSEQFNSDKNFWLNEFKENYAPADFEVDPINLKTERILFKIEESLDTRIKEFCKQNSTTVFRFVLSVFFVYFNKYFRKDDFVIATGHHNRINEAEKNIAAMTVSTIPIRIKIQDEIEFKEFLNIVSCKVKECLSHQQFPIETLTNIFRQNDWDPQNLFDIMLNHIPGTDTDYKVERYSPNADTSVLNIKINPNQLSKEDILEFAIDYRIASFDYIEIELLFKRFIKIIETIIQNPMILLKNIDILPEEENNLLNSFNNTEQLFPVDLTFQDLFLKQVNLTPENTAVVSNNIKYSYSEIKTMSEKISDYIKLHISTENKIIAVMFEPSHLYIVSIIGILFAGCSFIPVSPEYPKKRIEFIIQSSNAALLITLSNLQHLVTDFKTQIIFIEDILNMNLPGQKQIFFKADDPVYIIYTSGTTGEPKGVVIQNKSLVNLCFWHNSFYNIKPEDRISVYINFIFDMSIVEIFPAMIIGAGLYIVENETKLSMEKLNDFYEENKITISNLPTAIGEIFIRTVNNNSLRFLILGGEKLTDISDSKFNIVNGYGPTEAAVYTTVFKVNDNYNNLPIGKPIANVKTYVVDEKLSLVPIGASGELLVSGINLSSGYLNQDQLTDEKFINNPFCNLKNYEKAYKTGDIVKMRPSGDLIYLGRSDTQIKIRGHRIEPGEIEKQILKNSQIKKVVVINYRFNDKTILSAFIESNIEINIDELKNNIAVYLPHFMLPELYFTDIKIPMKINGKIDREKLAGFVKERIEKQQKTNIAKKILPENKTQKALYRIWKNILKYDDFSINDNFLDIGGDSILIIKMASQIEKIFGKAISYSLIVEKGNIKNIALLIDNETSSQNMVKLKIDSKEAQNLFFIHDLSGEVLSYLKLIESLGSGYNSYGLRFTHDKDDKIDTVKDLALDYTAQILKISDNDTYFLVGYSLGGIIAYEMACLLSQQHNKKVNLIIIDTPNFFIYPELIRDYKLLVLKSLFQWHHVLTFRQIISFLKNKLSDLIKRYKRKNKAINIFNPQYLMQKISNNFYPDKFYGNTLLIKSLKRKESLLPKLGWDNYCCGNFEISITKGDHIDLMKKEKVKYTAEILLEFINKLKDKK